MLRRLALVGLLTAGTFLVWPGQPGGRLVRTYGDLVTADRVAVIVPGADTTVATFDDSTRRPGGAARALLAEAARLAPGERLAVVAWLGYDSPPTLSLGAVTHAAADEGAVELRRTVAALRTRTSAPIVLLCHSYGSVLCAKAAAPGLPVSDLAIFGSPGLDVSSAAALGPRVWAGLGDNDWIRFIPKTKLGPLGFGTDPMSPGFGARAFEAGAGGHSDYFAPNTLSLRNLALIALGHPGRVTS
ncbi:alpha/beta hydrolase family protein [Nonomuraea polychroma]|uniref:Alpha/beta hydrolase family protein n=1 Tax=Nonomuraea polychroma TaxID=46176 RepID=A0A438M2X0_9ACTN|nr:alpha/beta hydrolase [Nonomuraea polychroma]RVX40114.1 alpha/beta hydrolase family protein [Nonomuraea polychroma]